MSYFASIDLKSFFASVECIERGLNPMTTNLVVADQTRTDKTICLAVSPSLKSYGLGGRARLYEVVSKAKQVNAERKLHAPLGTFLGKSYDNDKLQSNPHLALDYLIATPRMRYYIDYSSKIYQIYLRHVSPADIFAYSIDEVFCDITSYLKMTGLTPEEFVTQMLVEVYHETGIVATAGIGTNLFLAKVAMDIVAKHTQPNSHGVRIALLNELSFRQQLWEHTPITDFWRVGRGYAKRLSSHSMYTMGDVAYCSLHNMELLYKLFGVNAELLIDHAWGYEPTEIRDVKSHRPDTKSISSGQVLARPYNHTEANVIVREMAESLALQLVSKDYLTNHLVLHLDYAPGNSTKTSVLDFYGRRVPKPAHGTYRLPRATSSSKLIIEGFTKLFTDIANPEFTVRKVTVAACDLIDYNSYEEIVDQPTLPAQLDFFTNYAELERQKSRELQTLRTEHNLQKAILGIRKRYGKNAILRGTNFEAGATGRQRHHQIGGHRA